MMTADIASRSLNDIYGWPDETGPAVTPMIERVHAALRRPLSQLEPGEMRLLIGQQMCLDRLVPIAIAGLETDPFLETDHYAGDLLAMCLSVEQAFWNAEPGLRRRLEAVALKVAVEPRDDWDAYRHRDIVSAAKDFLNSYAS